MLKGKIDIAKIKSSIQDNMIISNMKFQNAKAVISDITSLIFYPIILISAMTLMASVSSKNSSKQVLIIDEAENIITSNREYDLLISNAINYKDKLETSGVIIDTNVINESLVYVDNVESLNKDIESSNTNEIEYTHYYFNDMVITNYIDNNELKSNVIKFKSDQGIETSLTSLDNITTIDNGNMIGVDIVGKIQDGLENKEETPISDIDNITIKLATDINDVLAGVKESNNLISSNSKKSIKESKLTKVNYIKLGKENIEDTNYNIAFVQLIKRDTDNTIVLNLICKLDAGYKITDIITL